MLLIGVLTGLFVLVLLVVLHELGHAIVAKRNGVGVEEFGVGFPPKAKAWKIKKSFLGRDVVFSLNWLPLGGFVKLKGEHDSADKEGDYGAASYWVKTKILLSGVAMNWVTAMVLFTILALVGIPKILPNQFSVPSDTTVVSQELLVGYIEEGSAADNAGLKIGDEITELNNTKIDNADQLSAITSDLRGENIEITYIRDDQEATVDATLRELNEDDKGFLGVASRQTTELRSTWSAPIVGVGLTVQLTGETFKALGEMVANLAKGVGSKFVADETVRKDGQEALDTAAQNVTGPVGILGVIFPEIQKAGLKPLVLISAIISLSLAVMNFLPIPALDGGRWFTMTVFRLIRRPLTKEREEKIQTIGFLVLIGLVILVTVADVGKIVG